MIIVLKEEEEINTWFQVPDSECPILSRGM
jgi:hypothetical protein